MASDSFRSAMNEFQTRLGNPKLSTGSSDLDTLLGGIEAGRFYLFYGDEEEGLADRVLHILLVNGLKPRSQGGFGGKCVYLNCGNYKRTRTMLDINLIMELIKIADLDAPEALRRIYTICAFSEDQQIKAIDAVEELVKKDEEIRLVVVQQIAKLFFPRQPGGDRRSGDFQRTLLKLKQACVQHHIALIVTCRLGRGGMGRIRWPEGGDYLKYEANVITQLRMVDSKQFVGAAYLLKHPERGLGTCEVEFDQGDEKLGRVTRSFRERLQNEMENLKKNYRETLKDEERQKAFDKLWEAWASEEGAMVNSSIPTALDVLLLTAVVDNRKALEELRREIPSKV